jgi:hypothetical protein
MDWNHDPETVQFSDRNPAARLEREEQRRA